MDFFSIPHMIVVLLVVVVLFGAGKLPTVMGDFAKGIKAFKAGMREDEPIPPPPQVQPPAAAPPVEAAVDRPHEHV
jgi:sec-independent protein translocase protein TatA